MAKRKSAANETSEFFEVTGFVGLAQGVSLRSLRGKMPATKAAPESQRLHATQANVLDRYAERSMLVFR